MGVGVSPHFANADAKKHNVNAAAKHITASWEDKEVTPGMISRQRLFRH
jgi:hypothetical protein